MEPKIIEPHGGITLIGGGPVSARLLRRALTLAPRLVAADGGANRALELGLEPEAVIGDLDSLSAEAAVRLAPRLHRVAEQVTTDFDKALRHIEARFVLAVGFSGGRLDHALAALSTLAAHPRTRCLLLSDSDVSFLAPPELALRLAPGSRISLYPLAPVRGWQQGLVWPLEGLEFRPDGRIGTSNEVATPEVQLGFDRPHMLVILPLAALRAALDGLATAPLFPGE